MVTVTQMNYSNFMENHPEISVLLRVILQSDPLHIVDGVSSNGVPCVVIGGQEDHFTFSKTDSGYEVKKTK